MTSIVTFQTPSGVILKVRKSCFKVELVNFGHYCPKSGKLYTKRARDMNSGSKLGVLSATKSIKAVSTTSEAVFKVIFKVNFKIDGFFYQYVDNSTEKTISSQLLLVQM